jgi:Stress responsive A/B Barrel Domain
MVRHVFMWQVAPDADPDEIVATLNTLPGKVAGIQGWEIGSHQGEKGDSGDPWDGVLVSDFDSFEGLQQYSEHPYHMEVVEKLMPMFSARAVCDFEREEA